MKKILFLLNLLFLSCNSIALKDNCFEGNWSFHIANGFNCYSCPKIEFDNNGKGNLTLISSEKINFTYELIQSNQIKIDFKNSELQSFFKPSEIFYYEIETVDNHQYFDLIDIKNQEMIHTFIRSKLNTH